MMASLWRQEPSDVAHIKESPLTFPSMGSESIVTLNEHLLDLFHDALMVPGVKLGTWFSLCSAIHLYSLPESSVTPQPRVPSRAQFHIGAGTEQRYFTYTFTPTFFSLH